MRLVKPNVEVIDEPDLLKRIELCGRVCWASEDKIKEGSDERFFKNIVKRGHTSVLEHSRLVIETLNVETTKHLRNILIEYENDTGLPAFVRNCGLTTKIGYTDDTIWSANIRAWRALVQNYTSEPVFIAAFYGSVFFKDLFENANIGNVDFMEAVRDELGQAELIPCDPEHRDAHEYITFRLTCSRAIANELVRHRLGSYTQSSTRYINYKEDFPVIEPWWFEEATKEDRDTFVVCNESAETSYFDMSYIDKPQPQKSRDLLPSDMMCYIYFTATYEYLKKRVFPLRSDSAAHPDIRLLSDKMKIVVEERSRKGALLD